MVAILVFAVALFLAALISELADRSIVSTTVLFLVVGFVAGPQLLGLIELAPQSHVLSRLAEFAMFTVLFTDGMELAKKDLLRSWRLPTLALAVGLPLTVLGTAALGRYVVGLSWIQALLVGAVLAPTDPVFASAIVGRQGIPARLRNLLNIESGLNDGLALPLVVVLLAVATHRPAEPWRPIIELLGGILLGIAVPWLGHRIEQLKAFTVAEKYEALFAVALGLFVYAASALTGVNMFLAAFAAGVTVATIQPRFRHTFCEFGELISELLKLATVMLFGVLMSPAFLREVPWSGYLFAVLTLLLVRPVALEIALHRARLNRYERTAAYWFGPKGFASIVYGIFVARSSLADGPQLFRLIAVVVALSILAHSSTDVIIARWFEPKRRRSDDDAPSATAASHG